MMEFRNVSNPGVTVPDNRDAGSIGWLKNEVGLKELESSLITLIHVVSNFKIYGFDLFRTIEQRSNFSCTL